MIEIEELILQLPNVDAEEGQRIGSQVAQRIAKLLPPETTGFMDNINLQMNLPPQASSEQMVHLVSDAIVNSIVSSTPKKLPTPSNQAL